MRCKGTHFLANTRPLSRPKEKINNVLHFRGFTLEMVPWKDCVAPLCTQAGQTLPENDKSMVLAGTRRRIHSIHAGNQSVSFLTVFVTL